MEKIPATVIMEYSKMLVPTVTWRTIKGLLLLQLSGTKSRRDRIEIDN